jgi:hypothetical protein
MAEGMLWLTLHAWYILLPLSLQLTVPPQVFKQLQAKWKEDVPSVECKPKHTFCHVMESCESVVKKA